MSQLIDTFGRTITYLRLSVTDRCDFRCVYCMAEDMTFVPRSDVLSFEELALVAQAFVELGVTKIRLTGGEPLIRKDIALAVEKIAAIEGLETLCLSTNASHLEAQAASLKAAGIDRINVSLDSLQPDKFKQLTRTGDVTKVIAGIDTAIEAGFVGLKINAVILRGRNDDEILDLVDFARQRNIDVCFIEEMPLGSIIEHNRSLAFMPSAEIKEVIETRYTLTPTGESTGGPARYFTMPDASSRVGFISPHSDNFCGHCNRVRVTAEGTLILCLGNEDAVDLRHIIRNNAHPLPLLKQAITAAMAYKPEKHHFDLDAPVDIVRFMNATGG
jgi:cyclic pyranopterin phosphate synthase